MKAKTVIVCCSYSKAEKDIKEILMDLFQLYLQKELLKLAIGKDM